MTTTLQGTRVNSRAEATGKDGYIPGCYWPVGDEGRRQWWIIDPTGHIGRLGTGHSITEFEDGTITVSPSILSTVADHGHDWHGYLREGVWEEC
jgi:hypothetical protein